MILKNYIYVPILIICIMIIFLPNNITASPTLPDPGTKSTTSFTHINSDYGPRKIQPGEGSNPHIGIDYDIKTDKKAYAVEGGDITNTVKNGDGSYFWRWKD